MRKLMVAAGAALLMVGMWPGVGSASALDNPEPNSWLTAADGEAVAAGPTRVGPLSAERSEPETADEEPTAAESSAAVDEATDRLEDGPADALVACGDEGDVEVCVRRLKAPATAQDAPEAPADPLVAAVTVPQTVSLDPAPECLGTGSDGFRVQPVLAHTAATAPQSSVDQIAVALGNIDYAISVSASRTGGSRDLRWITDNGSPGCRAQLVTTQITTGAVSYEALMSELESLAVVPPFGNGATKFIVFTDGVIEPGFDATCGLGEAVIDDTEWRPDALNGNEYGTRSAVDPRCWDINDGGSAPAHEILHTLGAVQPSAPNYANQGHCDDEYDLLCYGPAGSLSYPCPAWSDQQFLDCNNDDYFNTDPLAGQYLCNHWNTADSPYLHGGPDTAGYLPQPPRAVTSMSQSVNGLDALVTWGDTASCFGASAFRVSVSGIGTLDTEFLGVEFGGPPGNYTVTVWPISPYNAALGAPRSTVVTLADPVVPAAPNQPPVGEMVLSLTDGRGYGMLGYAIDPETGAPARMRVTIPGVINREYDWNYTWADMPRFTGLNNTQAFVFLAQLPAGTHTVCLDALDPQGGGWNRLECHTHTVK